MPSSRNTNIQLRTITIVGAGAAAAVLLTIFGYLIFKSEKKSKKKSQTDATATAAAAAATTTPTTTRTTISIEDTNERTEVEKNDVVECCCSTPAPILTKMPNDDTDTDVVVVDAVLDSNKMNINEEDNRKAQSQVGAATANTNETSDELSSDSGHGDTVSSRSVDGLLTTPPPQPQQLQVQVAAQLQQAQIPKSNTVMTNLTTTTTIPQSVSSMSISSNVSAYNEADVIVIYDFHFPRKYCGKLIGRNGVHVDYIRKKTQVQIAVRDDPSVEDLQIVRLSGYIGNVEDALDIISERFPPQHYPTLSFKPISKPIKYKRKAGQMNTSVSQMNLSTITSSCSVDSFTNITASSVDTSLNASSSLGYTSLNVSDTTSSVGSDGQKVFVSATQFVHLPQTSYQLDIHVSAIVNATHLFIQLPFNPGYEYLQRLDEDMLHLYSNINDDIPNLQSPLEYGTICAAPTSYGWHRAMITNYYTKLDIEANSDLAAMLYYNHDEPCDIATVKFLDYGGYLNIPANQLKQLRADFMYLPFQAIEVYLDGVTPVEGQDEDGKNALAKLIRNVKLKAIVSSYSKDDNVPFIKLYQINTKNNDDQNNTILLNDELVKLGYAQKL